jgi:hypothetical protein
MSQGRLERKRLRIEGAGQIGHVECESGEAPDVVADIGTGAGGQGGGDGIDALATSTDLSIRQIQSKIAGRVSRDIIGEITKRARATQQAAL